MNIQINAGNPWLIPGNQVPSDDVVMPAHLEVEQILSSLL